MASSPSSTYATVAGRFRGKVAAMDTRMSTATDVYDRIRELFDNVPTSKRGLQPDGAWYALLVDALKKMYINDQFKSTAPDRHALCNTYLVDVAFGKDIGRRFFNDENVLPVDAMLRFSTFYASLIADVFGVYSATAEEFVFGCGMWVAFKDVFDDFMKTPPPTKQFIDDGVGVVHLVYNTATHYPYYLPLLPSNVAWKPVIDALRLMAENGYGNAVDRLNAKLSLFPYLSDPKYFAGTAWEIEDEITVDAAHVTVVAPIPATATITGVANVEDATHPKRCHCCAKTGTRPPGEPTISDALLAVVEQELERIRAETPAMRTRLQRRKRAREF